MGKIIPKPLQVNPIKLSQPMGATLAFLGIDKCMPLMHSAQGCTSFTKVFFTRHFSEPIAIQTTAVSDITAIVDGGDYSITTAIENITKKITPSLIGLFTSGLTETKGDDIRGISAQIDFPLVYVNTPDYEGAFESGWSLSVKAMIEQLVEAKSEIDEYKVTILPNVSMQPIEVERLKEFLAEFGYETLALPDLSSSLDGFLGEGQAGLSSGGITIEEIKSLANSKIVITIGASMKKVAEALIEKNPKITHIHLDSIIGLNASDELVEKLLEVKSLKVTNRVDRWRKRLQDAMLDSHFVIGKSSIAIAGEPDLVYALSKALNEIGANIKLVISTTNSPILEKIEAHSVKVGDLEDVEKEISDIDLLITNFHGEAIARRHKKAFMLRGYPDFEYIGGQLKNDSLYEGSCYFLFEVANILRSSHE